MLKIIEELWEQNSLFSHFRTKIFLNISIIFMDFIFHQYIFIKLNSKILSFDRFRDGFRLSLFIS